MKILVASILVALIFIPTSAAFGYKGLSIYETECTVDCNYKYASIDSSKPMNFILLGMMSLLGLGVLIKYNRLGKYETFSTTCQRCGKKTNGLKCPVCEAEKQRVM